jgi:hypothetical protein
MSDGPHKSLPMRRHWKKLAERAETPAYSLGDVTEALSFALKKDFQKSLVLQIQEILSGGDQILLFNDHCKDQLEAVRRDCRGSAADNLLIDCAIEAVTEGLTGHPASRSALENALDAYALGASRQIEEHYLRKEPRSTANIRDRLKAARAQCSNTVLASEMLSIKPASSNGYGLPKHTSIDEGVAL